MPILDARVDAYIASAVPFARPILLHLRQLVHQGCPQAEEAIKWSHPHFLYKQGMLCRMAAFKEHCSFGFWPASQILGERAGQEKHAMGDFGRLTSLEDLPPDATLLGYIRKAMNLKDSGVKPARPPRAAKPPMEPPPELLAALAANSSARATLEALTPSKRREYFEWIAEAKTAATRQRRLDQSAILLSEGKSLYWKYQK